MKQLLMIAALFTTTALIGASKRAPDEVVPFKEIGNGEQLSLHIYKPKGHKVSDKRPAVVLYFGGGWFGGGVGHFAKQANYFASRGMVAICPEYRTKKSHNVTPDVCVSDGKSAMRWIRGHASELGINPDMIAAGGGSAGGHIAATTALIEAFDAPTDDTSVSPKPQLLLLFNPVVDNGPGGYGHNRVEQIWKKFSPAHNITAGIPPTIFFLGTKDKLIPVSVGENFKKNVDKVGGTCDLHLYEDMGHGFFNGKKFNDTLYKADKFLAKYGFLTGEPTVK